MALSTSTDGSISSQTNTQNPQTATQPATSAATASGVQPGTTTSLLTSQQGGVPLYSTALPTVTLGQAPATPQVAGGNTGSAPPKHHVDAALFVLPALLIVVAVVFFWLTSRSVKSTTE